MIQIGHAGDIETGKSTSGYVFQLGDSAISWSSRKQATVARSSTEAEYVALSSATHEAIRLRLLMGDRGKGMGTPAIVYEDNQGAIELAKNAKYHSRTKRIDISHHFVRVRVMFKEIRVKYCPINEMVADIITKGLAKPSFQILRKLLGIDAIWTIYCCILNCYYSIYIKCEC